MSDLVARVLRSAAGPLEVARRLQARGLSRVALLHDALGGCSYVAAEPEAESDALDPWDLAAPLGGTLASAPRWIGVIPYEARRGLERERYRVPERRPEPIVTRPRWWRYPAVLRFDPGRGEAWCIGTSLGACERLRREAERPCQAPAAELELAVRAADPDEAHLDRVRRAIELILAGDLYQVNLARRLDLRLAAGRPLDLYQALGRQAPARFGAALDLGDDISVLSTSPELLLHAAAGPGGRFERLATEPIKGTRPRGRHAAEDEALRRELDADPKERAELAMIVDVERNDLGSVAMPGSVIVARQGEVVTYRTVHHREALLVARARDLPRRAVIEAMVPSGSVTGAPKVRAMEVIAELEAHRRGLYTGAIGQVGHDGSVTLAMAIRTAVLRGREGCYFTGGGIVLDSDPRRELEETGWKALQLSRLTTPSGGA